MPDSSINSDSGFKHLPVLADAVSQPVAALPAQLLDGGLMIDATLGGGGHSALLLERHPDLRLIGLDQDPTARAAAAERLALFGDRVTIV
ncbi:MAG: 16S rRNA (cytosine(1402)-N(4))-methyltransferase, partial [Cyanobacteriota bacterium]|nr:16S rRNA (cytosine(1402)-N(4))-methyltransferase [Cyanobacteriota bacterium]